MGEGQSVFMGVDPGLSGAIAFYQPVTRRLVVEAMPVHKINGKQHIDVYAIADIVDRFKPHIKMAVIEDVHSMPKQGVASTFTFGKCTGAIHGVVAAHKLPMLLVPPHQWKRVMKVTADKDSSRQRASMLMPFGSGLWPLKGDDGKAEAALLAYYGASLK